jgi:metallo-beta-lactamase family protein
MFLTFWGAARTVTGSMHELTVGGRRFLLDCGLFQGRRKEAFERNRQFPFRASTVRGVVLSHAHIDHSGNLPSLARDGFQGEVNATGATVDLCHSMLRDSAFIQEKDVEFINRRKERRNSANGPVEPLYTPDDADRILDRMRPHAYHTPWAIDDELTIEFGEAGHLLGSAWTLVTSRHDGRKTRLLFSGDLGRPGLPIIRDPEPPPEADYLILESTYGGRLHKAEQLVIDSLADVVARTAARGGRIIIPAFAVGRTQQIVLLLHQLCEQKRIPDIPIFVDSPLAVNVTDAYRRHPECFDREAGKFLDSGRDPFGFRRVRYIREVAESKALNSLRGPMVVISASGMCEAGRILHHLHNNIEDPRNTVLIAGFQAEHTLGRKIVEKHAEVPVFGEPHRLRAEVAVINELSGHADQQGLLDWVRPNAGTLRGIFLVHGEPSQCEALQRALRESFNLEVHIPARGDRAELRA